MKNNKKTVLSGIQPSGELCIANYIGAMKNWIKIQEDYSSIFLIVDLHSITVSQVPSELRKRCYSYLCQYLAVGIDPDKSIIAIQSHIPEHLELMWILNTITPLGDLSRMTQFKDKSQKNKENINSGLFTYPVLMASDILLYNADLVPVGADQKQHLELTRNLATKFNNKFSHTFSIPDPLIPKKGSRIMSLQDPDSKMSKSDANLNNLISLLDEPDLIVRKIKRAVTDSKSEINYTNSKGLANLIDIYSSFSEKSIDEIEHFYIGKQYSDFKRDLGQIIIESLKPIQKEYNQLIKDKTYLDTILKNNSHRASQIARKTISKVYRKVGFVKKVR